MIAMYQGSTKEAEVVPYHLPLKKSRTCGALWIPRFRSIKGFVKAQKGSQLKLM